MKKIMFIAIVLAAELFAPPFIQAQGTLEVSNLGQTPTGSASIGRDAWVAQRIITGTDSSGYILNSIHLQMDAASGSPSGFNVSIYSINNSNFEPGNNLGSLSGSDPSAGGIFTYNASNIELSPSTIYYIVLTGATSVAQGAYNWDASSFAEGNNQWQIDDLSLSSPDGSSWTLDARGEAFQLAVYATEVPEPATLALAGLGLACLNFWRRGK